MIHANNQATRLQLMATTCVTILAALSAGGSALAQTSENGVEAVIVTGSRISRPGFTAPTPVTSMSSEDIERRAVTSVAAALDSLPAFRATNNPSTRTTSVSGPAGSSSADLRGLGSGRTLFLVDGRRGGALDRIPTLMAERVDAVTGGASAAYGSDAIAGVVNVILKKRMNGVQGLVQYGVSQEGDNIEYRVGLAAGRDYAGGKGSIVVGGDYVDNKGIGDIYSRDWGLRETSVIGNTTPGAQGLPARTIADNIHFTTMTRGGVIAAGPLAGTAFGIGGVPYQQQNGSLVVGNVTVGGEGFGLTNFNFQSLRVPVKRYAGMVYTNYELTDNLQAFAEFDYGGNESTSRNGARKEQGTLTIQRDNAFLPASIRAQMVSLNLTNFRFGRYHEDIGAVGAHTTSTTSRVAAGLNGKLGGTWSWDAYYQYSKSTTLVRTSENLLRNNFALAMDAIANPAVGGVAGVAVGAPICRSTLTAPTNGCVPINLFGYGSPSPAARAYVLGAGSDETNSELQVVAANLRANPFSTWAGEVAIAAGGEARWNKIYGSTDLISQAGGFYAGTNGPPSSGELNVWELYSEAVVPLAKDMTLAKSLELNGAVRYTRYSAAGPVTTWKVGAVYEPIEDVRLRVTRSRDIRAPDVAALYAPQGSANAPIRNPYSGLSIFVPVISGGNPNLTPEFAQTLTIGGTVTPSIIPGFRATVDYYRIKIKDIISGVGAQNIVDRCFANVPGNCDLVIYDAQNNLVSVRNYSQNLDKRDVRGVDIEADYRLPLENVFEGAPGTLTFRALANRTLKLATTDITGTVDRVGSFGDGTPSNDGLPKWVGTLNINYSVGDFNINSQVRYIGAGKYNALFIGPQDAGYSITLPNSINDNRVPAIAYLNLAASYNIDVGGRQVQLFGSINNVMNTDPPRSPSSSFSNTVNTVFYDVIGRSYSVGLRFRM